MHRIELRARQEIIDDVKAGKLDFPAFSVDDPAMVSDLVCAWKLARARANPARARQAEMRLDAAVESFHSMWVKATLMEGRHVPRHVIESYIGTGWAEYVLSRFGHPIYESLFLIP